jgi:hypothetical protein
MPPRSLASGPTSGRRKETNGRIAADYHVEGFMLLINIQRARAQYNDMLAEAEARRRGQRSQVGALKRGKQLIAHVLDALRRSLGGRA